ncbi:hypothetical protein, partial [uncultured Microbulbifer sp.]|uniref:hypothetical protein n=1 Tax=uncultured Microbulbifer sp. TaxID=348147 RepID=UPI00260CB3C4
SHHAGDLLVFPWLAGGTTLSLQLPYYELIYVMAYFLSFHGSVVNGIKLQIITAAMHRDGQSQKMTGYTENARLLHRAPLLW